MCFQSKKFKSFQKDPCLMTSSLARAVSNVKFTLILAKIAYVLSVS